MSIWKLGKEEQAVFNIANIFKFYFSTFAESEKTRKVLYATNLRANSFWSKTRQAIRGDNLQTTKKRKKMI